LVGLAADFVQGERVWSEFTDALSGDGEAPLKIPRI
jgi:hypothetical protein